MKFDVVGIDMPNVDLAINVKEFPEPNGGAAMQNLSWQGGGKVATGIAASGRLGLNCAILGAVGSDDYGRFCKEDLGRHGVDTSHLIEREGCTTSFCVVLSNKKTMERSIIYKGGSTTMISEDELPMDYIRNTRFFFTAGASGVARRAALEAKAAGAEIFIDADSYSPALMEFAPQIDYFIASAFVYSSLFKDSKDYEANCASIRALGPKIVVFTFGENGCVGLSDDGFFELPAFHLDIVDTVGAGDVFHGAFLAGLANGMNALECARLASAVAAIKCTRIGGRAGIPDMATALKFLETGEIDYSEIDRRVEFYGQRLQVDRR